MATRTATPSFPHDSEKKPKNESSTDARDDRIPKNAIERVHADEISEPPAKKSSPRRVAANRRNAALSTGPKTLHGRGTLRKMPPGMVY